MSRKHRHTHVAVKTRHIMTEKEVLDRKLNDLSGGKNLLLDSVKAALADIAPQSDTVEFFSDKVPVEPIKIPEKIDLPKKSEPVKIVDPGDSIPLLPSPDIPAGAVVWDYLVADAFIPPEQVSEFLKIMHPCGPHSHETSPQFPGFHHIRVFKSQKALKYFSNTKDAPFDI